MNTCQNCLQLAEQVKALEAKVNELKSKLAKERSQQAAHRAYLNRQAQYESDYLPYFDDSEERR